MQSRLIELESKLKNFDYTYEFSDDARIHRNGRFNEMQIREKIRAMIKEGYSRELIKSMIQKNKSEHGTQFIGELE